jgi:hypothetical protein
MATLLERLDEIVLSFWKNAGKNRKFLGANIGGDRSGWTDFSVQTNVMGYDGCRGRRIARHHNRSHSQRVQFRNQRGGIRPGRIAESDDPGKFQRRWRTDCHGQNAEALRLKVIRRL